MAIGLAVTKKQTPLEFKSKHCLVIHVQNNQYYMLLHPPSHFNLQPPLLSQTSLKTIAQLWHQQSRQSKVNKNSSEATLD